MLVARRVVMSELRDQPRQAVQPTVPMHLHAAGLKASLSEHAVRVALGKCGARGCAHAAQQCPRGGARVFRFTVMCGCLHMHVHLGPAAPWEAPASGEHWGLFGFALLVTRI